MKFARVLIAVAAATLAAPTFADVREDAFASCVDLIRENLSPKTTKEAIEFASISKVDASTQTEFYFAFSSGMIQGATRKTPDLMTKSMEPSASCGGNPATRTIEWVTVNGKDVITSPQEF